MWRSTFSTTTIASSTTMPIASTRPKSDSMLSEKPNAAIAANVPIERHRDREQRDQARAPGLQEDAARRARRAPTASKSVWITASIDSRTKTVGL